jgi:nicotinate-nucleotide adenylyltransferase
MQWIAKPAGNPKRLGLLPGGFNPPTRAHIALAEAALSVVDQVVLVLPQVFPHKQYEGATEQERHEMLRRIASARKRIGAAVADRGLFIDIVREAREHYLAADIHVICGRDAAERIIGWDYGEPGAIEQMLREFRLLVAPREGQYLPPAHLAHAVQSLVAGDYDECSSTRIRTCDGDWAVLVPDEIRDLVERIYSPADASRNARSR